jgi:hypothetical protein
MHASFVLAQGSHRPALSLHTTAFLAAAARCHDALLQAPPTLRPFSQLPFVPTGPYAEPGPSLCASLWRILVRRNTILHPAQPLALPPDPSLIPVPAYTVTRQVWAAPPALSQALTQCSAAELFRACDSPSRRARLLSLQFRHAGAYLDTVQASISTSKSGGYSFCDSPNPAGGGHVHFLARPCAFFGGGTRGITSFSAWGGVNNFFCQLCLKCRKHKTLN